MYTDLGERHVSPAIASADTCLTDKDESRYPAVPLFTIFAVGVLCGHDSETSHIPDSDTHIYIYAINIYMYLHMCMNTCM